MRSSQVPGMLLKATVIVSAYSWSPTSDGDGLYDGVKATGPSKLDIMPVGAGDLLAKRQRCIGSVPLR